MRSSIRKHRLEVVGRQREPCGQRRMGLARPGLLPGGDEETWGSRAAEGEALRSGGAGGGRLLGNAKTSLPEWTGLLFQVVVLLLPFAENL